MANSNKFLYKDLSLSYRDPATSEFVPTSEVFARMSQEDQVNHRLRLVLGSRATNNTVMALARQSEVEEFRLNNSDETDETKQAYGKLVENIRRELGINNLYPDTHSQRTLSSVPSGAITFEKPQPIDFDTEVA